MSRVFAPEDYESLYDYNPLDSPAKCGLEIVAMLDTDEAYEFDILLVVRDIETGDIYAGYDSGCSCPTPFEDFTDLGKFVPIRTEDDFTRLVREHQSDYRGWNPSDVLDAYRKVREALKV